MGKQMSFQIVDSKPDRKKLGVDLVELAAKIKLHLASENSLIVSADDLRKLKALIVKIEKILNEGE